MVLAMHERRSRILRGLVASAVAGFTIVVVVSPPVAAGTTRADGAFDATALHAFVAHEVERNDLPGVSVGVVQGDRVVDVSGYGTTDGHHRVKPSTPFLLASVSKPLTAAAALQLVSAGKVRLDESVHTYLPEFEMADAAALRITVRQLLEHTSGLPLTSCDTRKDATTLKQYVGELRTVHLASRPGEVHSYCSGNYNLLGRMIEVVSGETYAGYMHRHVFDPLQMRHTFTSEQAARSAGMARGHRWLYGILDTHDERYNTSQLPSGFVVSTAEDMSHFLVAQLDGGRFDGRSVLEPSRVSAMQAPGVPVPGAAGDTYGLGWRHAELGGVQTIQHQGDSFYFHNLAFIDPRTRRGAVILVNGNGVLPISSSFKTLEAGVARIVDGRPAAPDAGMSLRQLFVVQDLVLALLLAVAAWPLVRMPHWIRRVRVDRAAGRRRRLRTVSRTTAEIMIPVAVLGLVRLVLAQLGAQSWSEGLSLFPDTGAWLWTVCLVVMLTGILRLSLVLGFNREGGWAAAPGTR